MPGQASIDVANRGVVKGWLVAQKRGESYLCISGERKAKIDSLYCRQDVIDAGITTENCGFSIEVASFLTEKSGDVEFSIESAGETLTAKSITLASIENHLSNSFFSLKSLNKIKHWQLNCYYRTGVSLNSFIAPKGLNFTDGYYTRLSFADTNNTRSLVELSPELNLEDIIASDLQLALVAKASHETNLHIRIVSDDTSQIIYDDIFTLTNEWQHHISNIPSEFSEKLGNGSAQLRICTKHFGRRFIDFAFSHLAEDAINIVLPQRNDVLAENAKDEINSPTNLLDNGDLSRWTKGISFDSSKRLLELADNWFLEFSKANLGKLSAAMVTDNAQQDPLKETLSTNFGIRVRSKGLNGYARLMLPFSRLALNITDYKISLDIEALNLGKSLVIPRLYLVARDNINEAAIVDFVRKQSVADRAVLQFKLSARQAETIQSRTSKLPVLNVALDIPEGSDFAIYSMQLEECITEASVDVSNKLVEKNIPFAFEDDCINQQLKVLKGLDDWASGKPVQAESVDAKIANTSVVTCNSKNEFSINIDGLKPHKLARPSRRFPLIDIIVPVYNACDDVLLCLSALIEKTDLLHRVLVINDGEDVRTANMLSAFNDVYNHLEVITNPQNMGYTKSVNIGIKHSNADWVVVLNSDTIVSEGWLGRLMNCALSEEKVGMVGALSNAASWQSVPFIHDKEGDWHLNPIPANMSVDEMAELVAEYSLRTYPSVGVINGFCQLINMNLLDKIGLLDEQAFPVGYGEENDMCARAVKAGYKLLIADDTYVYHAKSKSFGHEKRKVLAKQGSIALKKKHPDVDWGAVTKIIFENPALVQLREQLAKALGK